MKKLFQINDIRLKFIEAFSSGSVCIRVRGLPSQSTEAIDMWVGSFDLEEISANRPDAQGMFMFGLPLSIR